MSRIRSKNTKPEIAVRALLHRVGYRFSLNVRSLPGTPDIVLRKYKSVIFVHGCYWHRHRGCKDTTTPKTNTAEWEKKFKRNIERHRKAEKELNEQGWKVIVIWECEVPNTDKVRKLIEGKFKE